MSRPENAFLLSLSDSIYARLGEQFHSVDLPHGVEIQRNELNTGWVYFPTSAVLSMIASDRSAQTAETSMVGREGAAGLIEACGSGMSTIDSVAQVDGHAWRTPAAWCRKLALEEPDFAAAAWKIAELQLAESRQSALCQAMHKVEERFARWMLESFDRSGGRNPLPLTQEFLAAMLGVQRTTVSQFASELQRKDLIRYRRGQVEILDTAGLERLACDCRVLAQQQRARLGFSIPAQERHVH